MRNLTDWVRSHFLNTGFYKLVYTYFYCLCLCETKVAVQINRAVFYISLIWFWGAFGITVLKVSCFWCSLCKVIENEGLISYSRYNLLGIETSANIYSWHYMIHYIAKTQERQYMIYFSGDASLCMRICKQIIKKLSNNQK